jgi:hypothetical protein
VRYVRDLSFRLIDTAGSEIGVVTHAVADVEIGDTVRLPDGRPVEVVEVYDDEAGQEGGVHATLVVDDDSDTSDEEGREEGRRGLLELLDTFGVDISRREEIERLLGDDRETPSG